MSERRLIVAVGHRMLAIDFDSIEEVGDRMMVTPLPGLPAAMPGIVELRGNAVPAIDLGALSGVEAQHDRRSVVIANDGVRLLALLIDAVVGFEEEQDSASDGAVPLDVRGILGAIR